MSEEDKKTEQTAVAEETKEAPKEETSADGGAAQQVDLDDLLKEFDERKDSATSEETKAKPEAKEPSQVDLEAIATLERRLNEQEQREQRRELERLFDQISDGTNGDAVYAEAYLNAQAIRNPKLNQAWAQRNSNPKAWDKVFGELKSGFVKFAGKRVDKQATESKEAVASAIRSASTAAPQRDITNREVETMSKSDFDELQRKMGVSPV